MTPCQPVIACVAIHGNRKTRELFKEKESWAASHRLTQLVCIEEDPVWCKEQFEDLYKVLFTARRYSAMAIYIT